MDGSAVATAAAVGVAVSAGVVVCSAVMAVRTLSTQQGQNASGDPALVTEDGGGLQVLALDQQAEGPGDEGTLLTLDMVLADSDTAELALVSRLKAAAASSSEREPNVSFEEATEDMMWALEISRRGPTGLDDKPRPFGARSVLCALGAIAVTVLVFLFLLLLVRANFTEVATRDGLLLATGVPSYRGEEPVAAVAAAREFRRLISIAALPAATLWDLRDVTLVHRGTWRCLHVSSFTKFSDSHLWIEAADGMGIRIRGGKAFLREEWLGDEEAIELTGERFPANASKVEPVANFDVVLTG